MSGFVLLKKRCVTLLEMLIAMSLVSILLTSVFGLYSYLSTLEQAADSAREENFRLLFAQYRLAQVMPSTLLKKGNGKKAPPYPFYISNQITPYNEGISLVFVYDNGPDGDANFSKNLLARLFLDQNGSLILTSWPWDKEPKEGTVPMRKEILLEGVQKLDFAFYAPPRKEDRKKEIETEETYVSSQWHENSWPPPNIPPDQKIGIPAIVNITLTLKGEEKSTTWTYVLPHNQETILYTQ